MIKRLFGSGERSSSHEAEANPPACDGVFFGIHQPSGTPITRSMQETGHILVVGGTGSGKSSCIAIPTLRDTWRGRVLAIDIKGELYKRSGRAGLVLSPDEDETWGYDPFSLLHESDNPVASVRELANALCPVPPEDREPYWAQSAQKLLAGHLLFCWKHGASFIEAMVELQSTPVETLLQTERADPEVALSLGDMVGVSQKNLASFKNHVGNATFVFASDPKIKRAFSPTGNLGVITPSLLEQGHDIFLQIPQEKLVPWGAAFGLIIQQMLAAFARREEYAPVPILLLLDEFRQLGKMEHIKEALATLRSKNITILIVIQSLGQLDELYGIEARKGICDNCHWKAVLSAGDPDTQEYFSRLAGVEDRLKTSFSESGSSSTLSLILTGQQPSTSTSYTLEEKRRIKPEEFGRLHTGRPNNLQNEDLIVFRGAKHTRVRKLPYWQSEGRSSITREAQPRSSSRQPPPGRQSSSPAAESVKAWRERMEERFGVDPAQGTQITDFRSDMQRIKEVAQAGYPQPVPQQQTPVQPPAPEMEPEYPQEWEEEPEQIPLEWEEGLPPDRSPTRTRYAYTPGPSVPSPEPKPNWDELREKVKNAASYSRLDPHTKHQLRTSLQDAATRAKTGAEREHYQSLLRLSERFDTMGVPQSQPQPEPAHKQKEPEPAWSASVYEKSLEVYGKEGIGGLSLEEQYRRYYAVATPLERQQMRHYFETLTEAQQTPEQRATGLRIRSIFDECDSMARAPSPAYAPSSSPLERSRRATQEELVRRVQQRIKEQGHE